MAMQRMQIVCMNLLSCTTQEYFGMRCRDRAGWAVARALLLAAVLNTPAAPANAQENYPSRPVKIIAPQAPGGGVDLVARIMADRLRIAMGQSFVIENQRGAGG